MASGKLKAWSTYFFTCKTVVGQLLVQQRRHFCQERACKNSRLITCSLYLWQVIPHIRATKSTYQKEGIRCEIVWHRKQQKFPTRVPYHHIPVIICHKKSHHRLKGYSLKALAFGFHCLGLSKTVLVNTLGVCLV